MHSHRTTNNFVFHHNYFEGEVIIQKIGGVGELRIPMEDLESYMAAAIHAKRAAHLDSLSEHELLYGEIK